MPSLRSSNRKQQTRLSFSPLPSSSPAAADYPERRVAAVRYDHSPSPSKKQRVGYTSSSKPVLSPAKSYSSNTPTRSSQVVIVIDSPLRQKEHEDFSHSTQIALPTPLASSQNEVRDAQESDIVPLDSDPHDQSKKLLTMSKSRVTPARLGINALPLERAGNTMTKRNSADNNDEMSDNDTISLSDRSLRGGGHNEVILSSDEDFVPKSQKSTPSGTTRNELSTAGASPQTPRHGRTLSSSHTSPIRFLLGGSTSAVPLSRPQRLKSFTPTKKSRRKLSFSATPDSTSDEDVDIVPRTARKEPGKSASVTVLSEDSDEVLAITPKRKRQAKLAVKLSYSGDPPNSENDLQEDLEDLQETEVRRNRTRVRTNTSEKSTRQKQLDLLRRRHAGDKTVVLSSDSESHERTTNPQATPKDDDDFTDEPEEDSGTEAIRQSLRGGADLDEYDEDFVDDDDDTLGAPQDLQDMPLEFTRHAHKKPLEHFKDVVEWMVHNKLNPAFARHDPIYKIAVRKLDDEVQGYSGSKFLSAAWNAEFLNALKAHPESRTVNVPTMFEQKCQACNRSGHPAKYILTFSGKPYHRESLEDISDDEDDSDEVHGQRGVEGDHTSIQQQSFHLGRTCNANAETGHALYHWRYLLNQDIQNWLKDNGHTSPEKIVERANWNVKKREKYANTLVDSMVDDGEIKSLYKDFKQDLDRAREARPESASYGRRR